MQFVRTTNSEQDSRDVHGIDEVLYQGKAARDSARQQALRQLVKAEFDEGLYTLSPDRD